MGRSASSGPRPLHFVPVRTFPMRSPPKNRWWRWKAPSSCTACSVRSTWERRRRSSESYGRMARYRRR